MGGQTGETKMAKLLTDISLAPVASSFRPDPLAIAERDRREELRDQQSLTAAFFGDPLPGLSALDRRRNSERTHGAADRERRRSIFVAARPIPSPIMCATACTHGVMPSRGALAFLSSARHRCATRTSAVAPLAVALPKSTAQIVSSV